MKPNSLAMQQLYNCDGPNFGSFYYRGNTHPRGSIYHCDLQVTDVSVICVQGNTHPQGYVCGKHNTQGNIYHCDRVNIILSTKLIQAVDIIMTMVNCLFIAYYSLIPKPLFSVFICGGGKKRLVDLRRMLVLETPGSR